MRGSTRELFLGLVAGAALTTVMMSALLNPSLFPPSATLVPSIPAIASRLPPTAIPQSVSFLAAPAANVVPPTIVVAEPSPLPAPTQRPQIALLPTGEVSAVGDSVMLGAVNEMGSALGHLAIDAHIGRQASDAINILKARRAAGLLDSVVIVHVGNNGIFRTEQIDEMMQVLADVHRVVIANIKVPRRWEGLNNAALAESAALSQCCIGGLVWHQHRPVYSVLE